MNNTKEDFEKFIKHNILVSIIKDTDNKEVTQNAKELYLKEFGIVYESQNKSNAIVDLNYVEAEKIYDKTIQDITSKLNLTVTEYPFENSPNSFLYLKMNENLNAPIEIVDEYLYHINKHQSGVLLVENLTNNDYPFQNVLITSVVNSKKDKGLIQIQTQDMEGISNTLVNKMHTMKFNEMSKKLKM